MTGGFVNLNVGLINPPDYIVPNFRLGACFQRTENLLDEKEGGLCLNKDLPLPPAIVITKGQSYQEAYGRQVIKTGEEFIPEHTFSFTSIEPGTVRLVATSLTVYEKPAGPAPENSSGVEVKFE